MTPEERRTFAAWTLAACAVGLAAFALALLAPGCGDRRSWPEIVNDLPPDQRTDLVVEQPGAEPPPAPVDPRYAAWPVDRLDSIQRQWIHEGTAGPPPGWTVVVELARGSDGRIWCEVRGEWVHGWTQFWDSTVHVPPALGALSHELAHAWVWERVRAWNEVSRAIQPPVPLFDAEALASAAGH